MLLRPDRKEEVTIVFTKHVPLQAGPNDTMPFWSFYTVPLRPTLACGYYTMQEPLYVSIFTLLSIWNGLKKGIDPNNDSGIQRFSRIGILKTNINI